LSEDPNRKILKFNLHPRTPGNAALDPLFGETDPQRHRKNNTNAHEHGRPDRKTVGGDFGNQSHNR
jgi:hypothetical protein